MGRGRLAALGLTSALAAPVLADGVAYRVKDLRPTPPNAVVGVGPGEMASVGGTAVVALSAGGAGSELWTSDGTAAGTDLLADLSPGRESANPQSLMRVGNRLFFSAATPATGNELWSTDGTAAGTRLVRDIQPGPESSDPVALGALGGLLLFICDDGVHGYELWRSDGTGSGTSLVEDIWPGPASGAGWEAVVYHERLYFAGKDGQEGRELWRTNGTANGTFRVASIVPGSAGGEPANFVAATGLLFFTAADTTHGRELWATDGTGAGTRLVRDIEPGPTGAGVHPIGLVPGRLLFQAWRPSLGYELWKSDGSEAGTTLVRDIRPGPDSSYPGGKAKPVGNKLVFAATTSGEGRELWVTDSTTSGTMLVGDLYPGVEGSEPGFFHTSGVQVFFGAWHPEWHEIALWKTDGTPGGTTALAPMPSWAWNWELTGFAWTGSSWIYRFQWDDDFRSYAEELWRTDDTTAGTYEIVNVVPPAAGSYPGMLTPRGEGIVFDAWSGESYWNVLHRSDGTEEGTYALTPIVDRAREVVPLADGELLIAGMGLWRTDGDTLTPLLPVEHESAWLTPLDDFVLFSAVDEPIIHELWRTDGTGPGTYSISDLVPGGAPKVPSGLARVFDKVWFGGETAELEDIFLWESMGTPASTVPRPLDIPIDYQGIRAITPLEPQNGSFSFRVGDSLHRFDPLQNLRETIRTLNDNRFWTTPQRVMGESLYFFDLDALGDCALWKAGIGGGAATKVARVGCWSDGYEANPPLELVVFDGRLYFLGCEPAFGCEPWTSDGTAAGTARWMDLAAGELSSMPEGFREIDGRLYFGACQPASGCEPWVTDGSLAGTHRVADIAPGPLSSLGDHQPLWLNLESTQFVEANDRIFFPADDSTGEELWAMPIELFYDGFETGDVNRWSGGP